MSEWRARLESFDGQWSVAQDSLEVVADPQVEANGYLGETATADGVPFQLVTTPVQFAGEPAPPKRAPGVQRALRGDPRRHRLQRRRDDGAQGGGGRGVTAPSSPASTMVT